PAAARPRQPLRPPAGPPREHARAPPPPPAAAPAAESPVPPPPTEAPPAGPALPLLPGEPAVDEVPLLTASLPAELLVAASPEAALAVPGELSFVPARPPLAIAEMLRGAVPSVPGPRPDRGSSAFDLTKPLTGSSAVSGCSALANWGGQVEALQSMILAVLLFSLSAAGARTVITAVLLSLSALAPALAS